MVFMIGGDVGLMFRSLRGYPEEQEPRQGEPQTGEGREAAAARWTIRRKLMAARQGERPTG
jgi:hypothetical protein